MPLKPHPELHCLDFGRAIKLARNGSLIAREGWNGKQMFVYYEPARPAFPTGNLGSVHAARYFHEIEASQCFVQGHFVMKTAGDEIQPGWLASQSDMLANDWMVVLVYEDESVPGH